MDLNIFLPLGYLGVLVATFLSSTILPISSLAFVLLVLSLGYKSWLVLILATVGNYLGALTNYYFGKLGRNFFFSRFIKVKPDNIQRAKSLFNRWGSSLLFVSWIPFLGDALIIVSGMAEVNIVFFTVFVILGNSIRYIIIFNVIRTILPSG